MMNFNEDKSTYLLMDMFCKSLDRGKLVILKVCIDENLIKK